MASFYDNASIITIPSGYKVGTLYSQKPTDGTGDMSFTRTGDTATRLNSAGIIERCITNLALQSNVFSNASWTKTNTTIDGSIADPNGGTTAFSLAGSSSTSNTKTISQSPFTSSSDIKTFSIYAKANTHSFFQIRTSASASVNFDLTTGTFQLGSQLSALRTNIGGGWYRCQVTSTSATVNTAVLIQLVDSLSAAVNEASTTTNSIYIWRAQGQLGDFATNYIDTTTAAVTQGPVTNLPRLDYLGSTCPQLLMEPTRTNLALYSQMFDNSSWTKGGISVSGNVLASPDGYSNADLILEDTSFEAHRVTRTISWVSGTTYTISCFVKQGNGNRRFAILFPLQAFGVNLISNFNIQTGVITNSSGSITGKIENYGNGWYRCSCTATATISASGGYVLYLRQTDAATVTSYTGDGTSSMYFWGVQVEAGAYATSYIPTTAATVTRNLDDCRKTSITSLIGQTEGTMFVDFNKLSDSLPSTDPAYISLNANNTSTRVFLSYYVNTLSIQYRVNGTIIYANDFTLTQSRNKVAVGYKLNDLALYLNGTQIGTFAVTADFSTYNLTQFAFGVAVTNAQQFMARTNQALVFKTRLTNDELATLTTL